MHLRTLHGVCLHVLIASEQEMFWRVGRYDMGSQEKGGGVLLCTRCIITFSSHPFLPLLLQCDQHEQAPFHRIHLVPSHPDCRGTEAVSDLFTLVHGSPPPLTLDAGKE